MIDCWRHMRIVTASVAALLLCAVPAVATAAPHSYTVVIDKLKFGPLPTQLHKGDTIVCINKDMFRHSVTATNGQTLAISGYREVIIAKAGKSGRTVLSKAGKIAFVCRYHPNMRGVLEVK